MKAIYFEFSQVDESGNPALEAVLRQLCQENAELSSSEFRLAVSLRGRPGIMLNMSDPRLSQVGELIRVRLRGVGVEFVEHLYLDDEASDSGENACDGAPGAGRSPDAGATGEVGEALDAADLPSKFNFAELGNTRLGSYRLCLRNGRVCLRRGKWRLARKWFQSAHTMNPLSARPLYGLAQSEMGEGNYAAACVLLETVCSRRCYQSSYFYLLGEAYSACANYARAIVALERAVSLCPWEARYWETLGWAYLDNAQVVEAEERFSQLLTLSRDNPVGHCGLGVALMAQGFWEEAREHLTQAVALQQKYYLAWMHLARCDRELELLGEAERCYLQVWNSGESPLRADVACGLGELYMLERQPWRAVPFLRFAVAAGVESVRLDLADAYYVLGSLGKAARGYTTCLRLAVKGSNTGERPFYAVVKACCDTASAGDEAILTRRAVLGLLRCALESGRLAQCRRWVDKLRDCGASVAREGGFAVMEVVLCYCEGNVAGAVAAWREASARQGGSSSYWFQLGKAAELLGLTEKAVACYGQSVRLNGAGEEAALALGRLLCRRGQYAACAMALESWLERGKSAQGQLLAGVAWLKAGRADAALALLESADCGDAAKLWLGAALWLTGECLRARQCFAAVLGAEGAERADWVTQELLARDDGWLE